MQRRRDAELITPRAVPECAVQVIRVAGEQRLPDDIGGTRDLVRVVVGAIEDGRVESLRNVVEGVAGVGVGKRDEYDILVKGGFGGDEGGGEEDAFVDVVAYYYFEGFVVLSVEK